MISFIHSLCLLPAAAQYPGMNFGNFANLANTAVQIGSAIGEIQQFRNGNEPGYVPAHPGQEPTAAPVAFLGRTGGVANLAASLSNCDANIDGLCCIMPNYCHLHAICNSNGVPSSIVGIIGGLPTCTCKDGFYGDGKNHESGCLNVDECATGIARCEHLCQDLSPGYGCGCHPGFHISIDGYSCIDDDECYLRAHMCSHTCVNVPGSYMCTCPSGFALQSDGLTCEDIDECAREPCDFKDLCVNEPGGYSCACPDGWQVANDRCVDVDECERGVAGNSLLPCAGGSQICSNSAGGYKCSCAGGHAASTIIAPESVLPPRPATNSWTAAEYSKNFAMIINEAAVLKCDDVDECKLSVSEGVVLCPLPGSECVNLPGSFECTCPPGFQFQRRTLGCVDVDECAISTHDCGIQEDCVNIDGGFECQCRAGYKRSAEGCEDIDECFEGTHSCTFQCRNSLGSYFCLCPDGLMLTDDHHRCQDINECSEGFCGSSCTNLLGSYLCVCPYGHYEDSTPVEYQVEDIYARWPEDVRIAATEWQKVILETPPDHPDIDAIRLRTEEIRQILQVITQRALPSVSCIDFNECDIKLSLCAENHDCHNLPGSFDCSCPPGYTADVDAAHVRPPAAASLAAIPIASGGAKRPLGANVLNSMAALTAWRRLEDAQLQGMSDASLTRHPLRDYPDVNAIHATAHSMDVPVWQVLQVDWLKHAYDRPCEDVNECEIGVFDEELGIYTNACVDLPCCTNLLGSFTCSRKTGIGRFASC